MNVSLCLVCLVAMNVCLSSRARSIPNRKHMFAEFNPGHNYLDKGSYRNRGMKEAKMTAILALRPQVEFCLCQKFGRKNCVAEEQTPEDILLPGEDIVYTPEQWQTQLEDCLSPHKAPLRVKRNIIDFGVYNGNKWPASAIGYRFDKTPGGYHSKTQIKLIREALDAWTRDTCLIFKEVTDFDEPHIKFTKGYGSGCFSYLGRVAMTLNEEWGQLINLADVCISKDEPGIMLHEIGHALGLLHQHTRPDRDDHVIVHKENIRANTESNFEKAIGTVTDGVPYDMKSVMHYGPQAFSDNGQNTLSAIRPNEERLMGQSVSLSHGDVRIINQMYCDPDKDCLKLALCENDGYRHPKTCQCKCPEGFIGEFCEATAAYVQDECGGVVTVQKGESTSISSPHFHDPLDEYLSNNPNDQKILNHPYKPGQHCTWKIQGASPTTKLQMEFLYNFKVAGESVDGKCQSCYDHVEIKYRGDFVPGGAMFCCNDPITEVLISTNNTVAILFRSSTLFSCSEYDYNRQGFQLNITGL